MWKDIPNWETYYEINENGEIRNIKTQQYLKHKIKTNGYHEVCLYINKKKNFLSSGKRYCQNKKNLCGAREPRKRVVTIAKFWGISLRGGTFYCSLEEVDT